VFSAGQETTVRLLGAALQVMGARPDVQQRLRTDRSLIPNFIEEALRIESPVKGDFRLPRVQVSVGGVEIPAGTTVMVVNGAANRDPRRFVDPDTFDPARKNAAAHRVRPRDPQLPRRTACPCRNPGGDRAATRPDRRDQDFASQARTGK